MKMQRFFMILLVLVLLMSPALTSLTTAQFTDIAITLAGLDGEVTVKVDAFGIPQIYASTPHDLFMVQGYLHAKDRWFQMDWGRRRALGSLSSLMGESYVESDTLIRTIGLNRTSKRDYDALSDDTKSMLQAYADGVNAWIADKSPEELAPEYTFIQRINPDVPLEIEPWEPIDSVSLGNILALDQEQSDFRLELVRQSVMDEVGLLALLIIVPPYPYDQHPIISEPGKDYGDEVALSLTPQPTLQGESKNRMNFLLVSSLLGDRGEANIGGNEINLSFDVPLDTPTGMGSNAWVVSGALTDTGLPYLANDPHMGNPIPAVWYQIGLHCNEVSAECPYNVYGQSIAGMTGVMVGQNDHIALGLTNSGVDTMDIYKLELNPDNPNQYLYEGEWVAAAVITETIEVAGGDPVDIEIRETRFGPMFPDLLELETPMALLWTGNLAPNGFIEAALRIDRAQNWEDFREAMSYMVVPALNLMYADVEGNIASTIIGRIPMRKTDGGLPVDGTDSTYEWDGLLDPAENPYIMNPEAGYLVAANNPFNRPDDFPYPTFTFYDFGQRAQRIEYLIRQADVVTADTMSAIQSDSFNPSASYVVPVLAEMDFQNDDFEDVAAWLAE